MEFSKLKLSSPFWTWPREAAAPCRRRTASPTMKVRLALSCGWAERVCSPAGRFVGGRLLPTTVRKEDSALPALVPASPRAARSLFVSGKRNGRCFGEEA